MSNEEKKAAGTEREFAPPEVGKTKKADKAEKKAKKADKSEKEEALQKELDEQKDMNLRLRAEYDNFRKRSQKEKEETHTSARADVIKNILPVLDNFERAAMNADASFEDYRKGVEMIFNQFNDLLKKTGVEMFGEVGEEFDPNMHNAVMHIESEDFGENVIAQVFQKGYKLGNTVIRFATVQVAN